MANHIKLPAERIQQLSALSKNLNMKIPDCIAMFINEQIAKGNLPDEVPGMKVERAGDRVKLDLGTFSKTLTRDLAKSYADTIRGITGPILKPSKNNPFLSDANLGAVRRGMSVKLLDLDTGAEKTVSRSVANDFAANLSKAAN
ncbi:hypothetical protein IMCC20628_02742 [Hoeflea sp. IMCC20628]|uniref:hypothetical protein n=1 Tax=Hoeflea sp. IMCC20628 TaxID=1620421 RepID=UPI00063BD547|nr:hypothetical protein [Hoeflea sp. IMCC20628]AKI01438.1 hypothetical protein IMCC20628_02742 [Hoeflea sp. IMCC20628]